MVDENENLSIENYFVSNEFVNSISSLGEILNNDKVNSEELIGYIVGAALRYYVLLDGIHKFSIEGMNQFVGKLADYISQNNITVYNYMDANKHIYSELLNEFLQELDVPEDKMKVEIVSNTVRDLIVACLVKKDYMFHGFNSYYLNSIKENGINPNVKESQEDIIMINNIFEKYGIKMGLGWAMFDTGKVSFSKTPSVSYDYAQRSPEWFSQFVGGASCYSENRNAFSDNNYEGARLNLTNLMISKGFSSDDFQKVINFFNQNWQKYANKSPVIVIAGERNQNDYMKKEIDFAREMNQKPNDIFFSFDGAVDCKTSQKIDTTNAKFIELPRHNELIKNIKLNNENHKML